MLEPLAWVLHGHVDFPRDCLPVVKQKVFVLFPIFCFVLGLFSRLGIIQNYVNFSTLSETEEAHPESLCWTGILLYSSTWSNSTSIQVRAVHKRAALSSAMYEIGCSKLIGANSSYGYCINTCRGFFQQCTNRLKLQKWIYYRDSPRKYCFKIKVLQRRLKCIKSKVPLVPAKSQLRVIVFRPFNLSNLMHTKCHL